MSDFKILVYPHPGLRKVAPPITVFDESLRSTIKQLFAKNYADNGVGLAATQVGLPLRLFVMDASADQSQPMCFINPVITAKVGMQEYDEGCLSFPGIYIRVKRAIQVTVAYQNEFGQPQTFTTEGLGAECIQHEAEHLDGIVFTDHLSKLKRMMVLKKFEKLQRIA